jgi:hypothetical protein
VSEVKGGGCERVWPGEPEAEGCRQRRGTWMRHFEDPKSNWRRLKKILVTIRLGAKSTVVLDSRLLWLGIFRLST